jgi:acyl-CoA thioester hydrolase
MNTHAGRREGSEVHAGTVPPEWIDANDHMNVAYYVLAFDLGVDSLLARFGITDEYIRHRAASTFAVECHVSYQRELRLADPYIVTSQLLAYDAKRVHQYMRMYHATAGYLAATCEWLNLHVDLATRRVTPWPADILAAIDAVAAAEGAGRQPENAGHRMNVPAPRWQVAGYGT